MTKITGDHLARSAYVYVRQSSIDQLLHNPESRRRQYALTTRACALVSSKSVRMCKRAAAHQPPVAGAEPVAPKGDRACNRARDSSGVFLNPNSCKGFEPEPSKEGSG